jgi:hypothetical protein
MITPTVNAEKIRDAVKELRNVDPNLVKELRKELRSKISPLARQVADNVPTDPPLSGFGNTGSTGWSDVVPKISFTPGRSRKTGNHLVSIRVQPRAAKRGLYIAELGGSRTRGASNRGRAMIRNLNSRYPMKGRGGRFAYTKFRLLRPDAVNLAKDALNRYVTQVNRKLKF